MKNLTFSVDERIVQQARKVAASMGKSLNQLVREYLARLAAETDVEREIAEFEALSRSSHGHSQGWRFNRDEVHEHT